MKKPVGFADPNFGLHINVKGLPAAHGINKKVDEEIVMYKRKLAIWEWLGNLPKLFRVFVCMIAAFVVSFPVEARAQLARDFLNAPVNSFSGFVDFVFSRGQSAASSDQPLPNDLTISRVVSPTFLYHSSLRGRYFGLGITAPYTRVKIESVGLDRTGFGDPTFAVHVNIFGLPSLTAEELKTAIPKTFLTAHINVTAPLGSYDRNRVVNVGANRWTFTPLVNLDIPLRKGVAWIDVYGQVRLFTDNNEYLVNKKLSQKPLTVLTGHFSHNIGKRFWASIGVHYDHGGETSIDGIRQGNIANGIRPAASFSTKFRKGRMTFTYENTASRPNSDARNSLIKIRFSSPLF